MAQDSLNVLLIEDSPEYAGLVQQWLVAAGGEVAFNLNWTDTLADGLDRLAQGVVDVALLDLGLPDSYGAETYVAIHAHAPNLPVIILSSADSESLALQLIREGADDYLVKSTCTGELLVRTVRYAVIRSRRRVNRANSSRDAEKARMIGVLGAKGGVGTTTVACTLASSLRHLTTRKVLLADMDMNGGLVSFLTGVEPNYSLLDAVNNLDRLDRSCWQSIAVQDEGGLEMIASPPMPGIETIAPEDLGKVLNLVSPFYDWIVMDMGRLHGASVRLADRMDEILLVTTSAISALHESKRVIDVLLDIGMERDKLRLVVNQTGDSAVLTGRELKQIFGIDVYAILTNDSQGLHEACLHRELPKPSSAIGIQISNLARRLAGIEDKKAKGKRSSFLSFVGLRNSSEDVSAV